jgi:hypothetical protein
MQWKNIMYHVETKQFEWRRRFFDRLLVFLMWLCSKSCAQIYINDTSIINFVCEFVVEKLKWSISYTR